MKAAEESETLSFSWRAYPAEIAMELVHCSRCGIILKSGQECPACRTKAEVAHARLTSPDRGGAIAEADVRSGSAPELREPVDDNPYRAPQTDLLSPTDEANASRLRKTGTVKLYSPGQVGAAAFLFSPIPGFWFLASNYRSLGQRSNAIKVLLCGVLFTALLFGIAAMLPNRSPTLVITAAYTWIIYSIAKNLQGKMYDQHVSQGGPTYSNWRVFGVSLLILVAAIAVVFVVLFIGGFVLYFTGHESWLGE